MTVVTSSVPGAHFLLLVRPDDVTTVARREFRLLHLLST
jgi:hypothetical protein